MQAYLLLALLFLLSIIVFVFQNPSLVTVHFLTWTSPEVSLAVVVLIAVLFGALITFLLSSVRYFKVSQKTKDLTAANQKLQKEINRLKDKQAEKTSGEERRDTGEKG